MTSYLFPRILKAHQDAEHLAYKKEYNRRYKQYEKKLQDEGDKCSHYTASVWGPEESISSRQRWQRLLGELLISHCFLRQRKMLNPPSSTVAKHCRRQSLPSVLDKLCS